MSEIAELLEFIAEVQKFGTSEYYCCIGGRENVLTLSNILQEVSERHRKRLINVLFGLLGGTFRSYNCIIVTINQLLLSSVQLNN